MFFNEGLNDRFYGYHKINKDITSDIRVDNILNNTSYEDIWFGTDWHLFKFNKETKEVYKNPDFEQIIRNYENVMTDRSVFIFLGDLMDDESQYYSQLSDLLDGVFKGINIMILGNNDLQPEKYYLDFLDFDYVFHAYQWGDYTFSHIPLNSFNSKYNIHGHLHEHKLDGYAYDNIDYKPSHIRLYTKEFDNKPINLKQVLDLYKRGYFNCNKK